MAKALKLSGRAPYFLIETCRRDATIGTWKAIQKVLEIKDSKMWEVITTFKYVENPKKQNKIE